FRRELQRRTNGLRGRLGPDRMAVETTVVIGQQAVRIAGVRFLLGPQLLLGLLKRRLILERRHSLFRLFATVLGRLLLVLVGLLVLRLLGGSDSGFRLGKLFAVDEVPQRLELLHPARVELVLLQP